MAVNSVKIEFVFDDKFSGPLKNAAGNLNGMNRALSNMGTTAALTNINKQVSEINASLGGAYGALTKFAGAWKALGTIANVFGAAFGGIFDYAKSFETNAIGISGILTSMATLNGKQMEWNQSLVISKDIMQQLRVAALQTAATSTDLIDTFRGLLGPGLGAGMKVNEIIEFTKVGVNAVKSMGLPSNQFLQELRGLEQGGIRASSSTLATALGLKDEDIKKARNSSEGLFKFLMDRLKGFAQATDATAGTMEGQIAILKEAVMGIGADAGESIFQSYSKALGKINELLLTKNPISGLMEINPEIVERVRSVADAVDSAISKIVDIGKVFADQWKFFGIIAGSMYVLPKVFDAMSVAAINFGTRLTGVADILFKQEDITKRLAEEYRVTTLSAISEKEKEMRAAMALNSEHEKTDKLLKEISKKLGIDMSKGAADLSAKMQKLGLSEKEAAEKINQYLGYIKNGTVEQRRFAGELEATIEKLYQEAQAAEKAASKGKNLGDWIKNGFSAISQFSGALSGAAMALTIVAGEQDGWTKTLSDGLFATDAMISAIGGMRNALSSLTTWWKTVDAASKVALANMALASAGIAAVAAVLYAAYDKIDHYNKYGVEGFAVSENGEEVIKVNPYDKISKGASASRRAAESADRRSNERFLASQKQNNYGNIGLLHPRQEEDKKAQKAAESAAEKAARELEQATKQYNNLDNALKVSIAKSSNHYSALQEKNAAILKQDEAWAEKIKEMAKKGVDANKIKEITLLKDKAIREQYLAAERDFNQKMNDLRLENAKNTMLFGGSQDDQYKAVNAALQTRKQYLETLLADEQLAADERLKIEQKLADTVRQIRTNDMYNFKTAWKATLQELSQQQIDYGAGIRTIYNEFTSFGQNMLDSTKSVTDQLRDLCKNLTNDILNMMMKIYMQGIMMNLIGNIFGGGGTNPKNIAYGKGAANYKSRIWNLPKFANGGYASGWAMVGERGPELVNFSNPGRVYTADQTRNALSGTGNGNINIKLDIKNETGTQIEAQQTGSSFDGENYVLGIVLKAFATNKGGIRNIVKGVATT